MDFSNKFGYKKSIKSRFKYDLEWILAGGRLDRISLVYTTYQADKRRSFQQFNGVLRSEQYIGLF